LTDREVANVDHLLHLALAFGDDLAHLHGDELPEVCFRLAERIAELPHGFTANRTRCGAPFRECFLRASDRTIIIFLGRRPHARQQFAVDRRELLDDRTAATPFAIECAGVLSGDAEPFQNLLH
jgi:hypothetical protein